MKPSAPRDPHLLASCSSASCHLGAAAADLGPANRSNRGGSSREYQSSLRRCRDHMPREYSKGMNVVIEVVMRRCGVVSLFVNVVSSRSHVLRSP